MFVYYMIQWEGDSKPVKSIKGQLLHGDILQ